MKLFEIGVVDNTADLNEDFASLEAQFAQVSTEVKFLREGYGLTDELSAAMNEVQARLAAAKHGLGLVNKLSPGPSKQKHARRVMSNLNIIRGQLARLTKELEMQLRDEQRQSPEDGPDYGRQWYDTSAE